MKLEKCRSGARGGRGEGTQGRGARGGTYHCYDIVQTARRPDIVASVACHQQRLSESINNNKIKCKYTPGESNRKGEWNRK